jgi:hypothetical protein
MAPTDRRPDDSLGLAALVCGAVSIPLLLYLVAGVPFGIAGIVLGYVGKRRAERGLAGNRGPAVAGMLCGSVGVILAGIAILLPDS